MPTFWVARLKTACKSCKEEDQSRSSYLEWKIASTFPLIMHRYLHKFLTPSPAGEGVKWFYNSLILNCKKVV
jgi:hypothetical protein